MSLLLNVREAMLAGGALWVETARTNDRSPGVRLLLGTARLGTAAAIREPLWEPFHRTKSNGTELGLWITRGVVQDHEGTIELRSQAGDGATWVIRLPGSDEPVADA
jgi:signal transduction histidine kinase